MKFLVNITLIDSCEKSRIVSFASSTMKNYIALPDQCTFAVKLICCIDLGLV